MDRSIVCVEHGLVLTAHICCGWNIKRIRIAAAALLISFVKPNLSSNWPTENCRKIKYFRFHVPQYKWVCHPSYGMQNRAECVCFLDVGGSRNYAITCGGCSLFYAHTQAAGVGLNFARTPETRIGGYRLFRVHCVSDQYDDEICKLNNN